MNLQNTIQRITGWQWIKEKSSESIEKDIVEKVRNQVNQYLVQFHKDTVQTILWQNGLLMISIFPVHWFHSTAPFYIAYGIVLAYTIFKLSKFWPEMRLAAKMRGIRKAIKLILEENIMNELKTLPTVQRILVEQFGPDLDRLSNQISVEILPDIRAVAISSTLTLIMAFIAFRMTVIPLLEHMALFKC